MENVLIVGGAGFIGSHLVEALLMKGDRVTVLDTMQFCYADNLDAVKKNPRLNVVHGDIIEYDAQLLRSLSSDKFEQIYFLAGVVATGDFIAAPHEALLVSILGIENVLQYKTHYSSTARVLFASSSEVYGNANVLPTPEFYLGNVSVDGPRSGYDEGKRAGEALIAAWRRQYDVQAAVVRIFNTYGKRMTANGRLVPTMVYSALAHKRICVNRPGTQKRTLLYVTDCIKALEKSMEIQSQRPINVGGVETFTMQEVAEIIAAEIYRRTGFRPAIEHVEEVPFDIADRQPDLSNATALLGWRPKVCFREGVRRVLDYWVDRIQRGFA